AIAYNSEFIYFIVVDGRNPGVSEGMTIGMLGRFSEFILGATDGVSLDGGGSSTMWVKSPLWIEGRVVNNPSDPCGQFLVYLPYISGSGVEPDAQTAIP
ncbi:MAG: hypothetical protein GWN61_22710, partial [candidate division Zixibacteria bacterium]|nr:phosphodiester glycosidase family protein [candidate division Zixibacteria bacterium]NIW49390.1 hypothetical protein [Gammaproteobacteria bacterium]NIR67294.1 phosphodiester glycosidase family protein [candidate division Zixibacteria bacterium]NIS48675.1 phosphodiester glycosidase family protein [candidate division Zixibacteria bacterium]NIU16745.1 phosphodiester glycosidase family protein [candidate division Zixibacteria bacterium]